MISTRVTAIPFEGKALGTQWLRNGQCVRCFHVSVRAKEGAPTQDDVKSATSNGPRRGPSQKERASMISNEVSKIQRGQSSAGRNGAPRIHQFNRKKDGSLSFKSGGSQGQAEGRAARFRSSNDRGDVRTAKTAMERPNREPTQPMGTAFEPQTITRTQLLHSGGGSATIANGNFDGVVEDHLATIIGPVQQDDRKLARTAAKMWQNQLVRFDAKEDAERVGEVLKEHVLKAREGLDLQLSKNEFSPIPPTVQKAFGERVIQGIYDVDGLLGGKEKFDQPILNDIAKQLAMNGTFLARDQSRVLSKVRSLLPSAAAAAARAPKKAKAAQS